MSPNVAGQLKDEFVGQCSVREATAQSFDDASFRFLEASSVFQKHVLVDSTRDRGRFLEPLAVHFEEGAGQLSLKAALSNFHARKHTGA